MSEYSQGILPILSNRELLDRNGEMRNHLIISKLFATLNEQGVTLARIMDNPKLSFEQANPKTLENFTAELLWKLSGMEFNDIAKIEHILPMRSVDEKAVGIFLSKAWPQIKNTQTGKRIIGLSTFIDDAGENISKEHKFFKALLIASDNNPNFLK